MQQVEIDHAQASESLSKAIACKERGMDYIAEQWMRELVTLLQCADILN